MSAQLAVQVRLLEPLWLPVLLLPVVAALVLARVQRRRAVRFTGVRFLEDLAPRAGGLLGTVLGVLAGMLLLLPLAEPRVDGTDATARANVVLVIDVSGSMAAEDVAPSRLTAAKAAAAVFVSSLPENWKSGVVAFSERAFVLAAPTDDRGVVLTAIESLAAQGGTATGDALDLALDLGRAGGAERLAEATAAKDALTNPSATVLVLLSDGAQTAGEIDAATAAERARSLGVPIHTIAFGTDAGRIEVLYPDGVVRPLDVPPDFASTARIAQTTGGQFFTAVTARELDLVYRSVGEVLERSETLRDPSVWLVLAAIVLAALALLGDLRRRTPEDRDG